jgi:ribosome-associated translation inhibitor RaiA
MLIKFKNLKKSDLTRLAVKEKVEPLIRKFPDLEEGGIQVTLEMENSPFKPGPELFKVKLFVSRGRYRGIVVKKSDANLFLALADLLNHMLEKLNRFGDRRRVKERKKARAIARAVEPIELDQAPEKTG